MFVHHIRRLAIVLCSVLLVDTPAFAQLDRSSVGAAREYVAATISLTEPFELPPNLEVTPMYRPALEMMARHSPTFRRQLQRIANQPRLSVALRGVRVPSAVRARATTYFVRGNDGWVTASIELSPLDDDVELIAHEFEHVIEMIDGVDLPASATLPNTGVRVVSPDGLVFETIRAKRIGLKVTQEVRAAGRRGD